MYKISLSLILIFMISVTASGVNAQAVAGSESEAIVAQSPTALGQAQSATELKRPAAANSAGPIKSLPLKSLKPMTNSTGQLMQVMLALFGVLALIFALAWLFKRFVQPISLNGQQIKVVSSLALGNKEKLVLAEVNGQQILLGVTAQNINCLKTFSVDEMATKNADSQSRGEAATDFKSKLKHVLQHSQS